MLKRILGGLLLLVVGLPVVAACQADRPAGEFVASSRGEVYYWTGCEAWRSLPPANLRFFPTAAEAEAAGYRPSTARGCSDPALTSAPGPSDTGTCTVARIVDGDTVVCTEASERIRLLLIDAPELSTGDSGEAARRQLEGFIPPGTEVRVVLDVEERDRYGRLLAYLYTTTGEMVNERMARTGYARPVVYPPNVRHIELIRAAAESARLAGDGLWAGDALR